MAKSKAIFLAYVPVLHQGYVEFFTRHAEIDSLWLLDTDILHQSRALVKDLRALTPLQIQKSILALKLVKHVELIDQKKLEDIAIEVEKNRHQEKLVLVVPDEEIMYQIINEYLPFADVKYDTIFLRWDKKRSLSREEPEPDVTITQAQLHQQLIQQASELGKKSSDWWRQVGGLLVKDGQVVLTARNIHVPQDQQHYVDGDPRADFQSGEMYELSSSVHAESELIAQAARLGLSTAGTSMYCTDFPCPTCAKLIAQAGTTHLYYSKGYSLLDGIMVLKSKGVEVIKVKD